MTANYSSNKETVNFARFSRLVVDICSDLLREVVRARFPSQTFYAALSNQKHQIFGHLSSKQKRILYPQGGVFSGKYDELDISLLYSILRHLGNIQPHQKGWGQMPDPSDRSLSANIDRLRIQRNEAFGHLETAALSDKDFTTRWNLVQQCVVDIQKDSNIAEPDYLEAMKRLATESIDPDTESMYIESLEKLYTADLEVKDIVKGVKGDVDTMKAKLNAIATHVGDIEELIVNSKAVGLNSDTEEQNLHRPLAEKKQQLEEIGRTLDRLGKDVQDVRRSLSFANTRTSTVDAPNDPSAAHNASKSTEITKRALREYFSSPPFINTWAYKTAHEVLMRTNMVLLHGEHGEGKTTLALSLMLSVCSEEECQVIHSPEELSEVVMRKPKCIVIDEAFDKLNSCAKEIRLWVEQKQIIRKYIEVNKGFVIATVSTTVYNKIDKDIDNLFPQNTNVAVSSTSLSHSAKVSILSAWNTFYNRCPNAASELVDVYKYDQLGFPLCCEMFSSIEFLYDSGKKFFENPSQSLMKYIDHLHQTTSLEYYMAILVMLKGGTLETRDIDPVCFTTHDEERCKTIWVECFHKAGVREEKPQFTIEYLERMVNDVREGLLKYDWRSKTFSFRHPLLYDKIKEHAFQVGKDMVLKYCSVDVIDEFEYISEGNSVSTEEFHIIFENIWNSMQLQKSFEVILVHDMFQNDEFFSLFFQRIRDINVEAEFFSFRNRNGICLEDWVIDTASKRIYQKSLWNYFKQIHLLKMILYELVHYKRRDVITSAVKFAVTYGYSDLFQLVLNKTNFCIADIPVSVLDDVAQYPSYEIFATICKSQLIEFTPHSTDNMRSTCYSRGNLQCMLHLLLYDLKLSEGSYCQQRYQYNRSTEMMDKFFTQSQYNLQELLHIALNELSSAFMECSPKYNSENFHKNIWNILMGRKSECEEGIISVVQKTSTCGIFQITVVTSETSLEEKLSIASTVGSTRVVKALLEEGADIDTITKLSCFSALDIACLSGQMETVTLLLGHWVRGQCDGEFRTAVHLSCIAGEVEILLALIKENKEELYRRDQRGMIPIEYAVFYGRLNIVNVLLKEANGNYLQECNFHSHIETGMSRADKWSALDNSNETVFIRFGSKDEYQKLARIIQFKTQRNGTGQEKSLRDICTTQ